MIKKETMEKIWLKNYPDGVPAEIGTVENDTIVKIFENSFKKYSERPAFKCMGRPMTFAEWDQKSTDFAAYLQNTAGMEKGARIALMAPNLLPNPVSSLAALRAGLIVVNVNPLYTPTELQHQLNDAGVETLIIFAGVLPTFVQIADKTSVKNVIVIGPQDLMAPEPAKPEIPDTMTWFSDALTKGADLEFTPPTISGDDICFLQYTGGTTGLSKGATLSHYNVAVNVAQTSSWIKPLLVEGEEIVVTALPLYHIFALVVNMMVYGSVGGCNLLIPNPRDMDAFVKQMDGEKITALTAVNTLFNGLMMHPEFRKRDFSTLKMCLGGGTAVQGAISDRWSDLTGIRIIEGYGLSETSPVISVNAPGGSQFSDSVGFPISSTEFSLRDDDGNEVAMGVEGEICVRGPQVMQGYWNKPEETANVMTDDGFFKTGDVAIVDENGSFKIVDRKKDMILVSGFNVYPNEVEAVLATSDDIVEAACVGVPDDKTGEAVKVFVVKKPGVTLDEDGVRDHCRTALTNYKIPKHVAFIEEVPKSAVGKILRRELRDT